MLTNGWLVVFDGISPIVGYLKPNPSHINIANINIGKNFLNLLDNHFNRDNPLRIFLIGTQ